MKGFALISLAGILAAAIFLTWRRSERDRPLPVDEIAAAADRIALRWAAEGPAMESRVITFVLTTNYSGTDPFALPADSASGSLWEKWFSEEGSGAFLRALQREHDTVVWPLGALAPAQEREFLEPFSRILIKSGRGGRVHIIAHGFAAGFAVRAAATAAPNTPLRGATPVDRLTAVGINSAILAQRYPNILTTAAPALGEWISLWSHTGAIAREIYVEHWMPGFAAPAGSVRPWGSAAWPAIVSGVSARGMNSLPGAEKIEVAPSVRPSRRPLGREDKEERQSGLEMLKDAEEKAHPKPKDEEKESGTFVIGDSGWITQKLKDFEYMAGREMFAHWARQGFRVQMFHFAKDTQGWRETNARSQCKKAGFKTTRAKHNGRSVDICNGIAGRETSRSDAHHDYFTILGRNYIITAVYTYDRPALRSQQLKRFMESIEALSLDLKKKTN
ncbi:MAG: hypothetical protein ABIJ96_18035 [Elusimicrobiota bacterium]